MQRLAHVALLFSNHIDSRKIRRLRERQKRTSRNTLPANRVNAVSRKIINNSLAFSFSKKEVRSFDSACSAIGRPRPSTPPFLCSLIKWLNTLVATFHRQTNQRIIAKHSDSQIDQKRYWDSALDRNPKRRSNENGAGLRSLN